MAINAKINCKMNTQQQSTSEKRRNSFSQTTLARMVLQAVAIDNTHDFFLPPMVVPTKITRLQFEFQ
eukprot:3654099-Amphidinium_carterae.1